MKKPITFLFLMFITSTLFSQVSKTVNLITAGTLSASLTSTEKVTIKNLTITGKIDARDVLCMRDAMHLYSIDISGASIQSFTGNGTNGNITYPANEMPSYSFKKVSSSNYDLKSIILPTNLTSIGEYAFHSCSVLEGNFTIPSSVTKIGKRAFGYSTITNGNIIIPETVTEIGSEAFISCNGGLSDDINLSKNILSIGNGAFADCYNIKNIYVNVENTKYKDLNGVLLSYNLDTIFQYPLARQGSYSIPNSVVHIANYAFDNSLISGTLSIPNSVITIGNNAFYNCTKLTGSLIIPNSVISIGSQAFYSCGFTRSLTIGNSVISIGDEAFSHCINMSGILTIGSSVENIGNGAFNECSGIKIIKSLNQIPPTIGSNIYTFYNVFPTIYVPSDIAVLAYKSSSGWSNFSSIVSEKRVVIENTTAGSLAASIIAT